MVKIILAGANGKMGKVIASCVSQRKDCSISAGIDLNNKEATDFPIFPAFNNLNAEGDVIIDFSHPSLLESTLQYAIGNKIPAVIATTGLNDDQLLMVQQASKKIPVFFSANMSIGVNLLIELAKKAAAILEGQFDIEIVEKHHNQKIDAPSGTALMAANEISAVLSAEPQYIYDRHSRRCKREANEIGIHSIRGGTIVGEHDIIFAGRDEVLTLSHTAMSKEIFATGAINAAIFLNKMDAGLYNMGDLIDHTNV